MKKFVIVSVALLLLAPLSTAPLINTSTKIEAGGKNLMMEKKDEGYVFNVKDSQFGAFVYTRCNGIEKITPLIDALLNPIDVDNNSSTGVDGKDIKINAFLLPYPEQFNNNFILALSLVFRITRMGEEIKDSDFQAYVHIDINGNVFRAGIGSEYGEELPKEARIVFTVVPYILYDKEPEYYINLEPVFEGEPSNISIFGEYEGKSHQYIQIDFQPAVTTIIKFVPKSEGKEIFIQREATRETTISMKYKGKFNANITIEKIPVLMSFIVSISDKRMEYKSDDEFNVTMIIEGRRSMCIRIVYIPHHIIVEGEEGRMSISMDNRRTEIMVSDKRYNPSSFLKISNLTGVVSVIWHTGLNGYFLMEGAKGAYVELYAMDGAFDLKSIKKAEYLSMSWNLSIPGSISVDTNWEWFAECSLNFTLMNFGIYLEANMMRADDYIIAWNNQPPSFYTQGKIEFGSISHLAILINGIWYTII